MPGDLGPGGGSETLKAKGNILHAIFQKYLFCFKINLGSAGYPERVFCIYHNRPSISGGLSLHLLK